MKQFIAILLCAVIPLVGLAASDNAYKVTYDGGSLQNVKAGNGLKLYIEEKQVRLVKDKTEVAVIPGDFRFLHRPGPHSWEQEGLIRADVVV